MNHESSEIDFTKLSNAAAVVGIENDNDSCSNGVGKTNLFNAIKYVLFNSKISDSKEKIVKYGAKSCYVEFQFKLNSGTYKIERKRAKSTQDVKLYKLENEWEDISGRTISQTNALIISILGINENTFENVCYLKQNDYKRRKIDTLPAATPEERKAIIFDMLQLNEWNLYEKEAKTLRDDVVNNINTIDAIVKSIGNPHDVIKENEDLLSIIEENVIHINSQLEIHQQSINDKTQELKLLESSKIDESELLDSIKKNTKIKAEITNQINTMKRTLNDKSPDPIIQNINKATKQKVDIQNQLDNLLVITEPENKLNEYNKAITHTTNEIHQQESCIKTHSKKIPDEDFCPTCGSELSDREKLEQEKTEKLNAAKLKKEQLSDKLKQLTSEKSKNESELKQYENYLKAVDTYANNITKLNSNIENYKELLEQNKKTIESIQNTIEAKQIELNSVESNIISQQKQLDEYNLKDYYDKVNTCKSELNACVGYYKQYKTKLEQLLLKKGESIKLIELKKSDIFKLEEYKKDKKELDSKRVLYKAACSCFSSSGIPAMIIHTVLGDLQQETNNILNVLKPQIQIKFIINKEKEDGTVVDTLDIHYYLDGLEYDFLDLSGGQQACVVLAIKLAMANVSRRRCGADLKLLLLDEVDQPLDKNSVDSLYDIIRDISKDSVVLVITHNKGFEGKFDSKITIEKKNNSSFIFN